MRLQTFKGPSQTASVVDPDLVAIRSALTTVIGEAQHRVRLKKTTASWMEATWSPHIGLQLQYRADGRLWSDPVPYLSPRRAMRILRSYGRGLNGWQRMVTWHPAVPCQSSSESLASRTERTRLSLYGMLPGKKILRELNARATTTCIILTVLGIVAGLFMLMADAAMTGRSSETPGLLDTWMRYGADGLQTWYVYGPYLALHGSALALSKSVRYVYADHLDHIPDHRGFYSGVAACVAGLLIIIAHLPTPG